MNTWQIVISVGTGALAGAGILVPILIYIIRKLGQHGRELSRLSARQQMIHNHLIDDLDWTENVHPGCNMCMDPDDSIEQYVEDDDLTWEPS